MFWKKFTNWSIGARTYIIGLEDKGCITANFENLSMQVRKIFLSVEKMLMFNTSPTCEGIGVLPCCFLGCRPYMALLQTLQFATTSQASFDMFGK